MSKWKKSLQLLISLVFLIGLLAPAVMPAGAEPTVRAHPLLLRLAVEHPDQTISVIVQKLVNDDRLEARVAQLGGRVTRDLHIINAFAAELSAGKALLLAREPSVRWVCLDAAVSGSGWDGGACKKKPCIDTSNLQNSYIRTIQADKAWNSAAYLQGQGVTVAVVDSGMVDYDDLKTYGGNPRMLTWVQSSNANPYHFDDYFGHGAFVAGVIGGNGQLTQGKYIGVAPKTNLIAVKVTDNSGAGTISDVVAGLQWIYEHKSEYNIRVINLSLNSSVPESYHTSPLDAAVEILWFNGIVVVVSAGNNGGSINGILYPPANDPFVITVGAANDMGTPGLSDDQMAAFSAYGVTDQGNAKPDLVAPGTNVTSLIGKPGNVFETQHANNRVYNAYIGKYDHFRLSGTSASAPMVTGAVALLLQDEPNLTPDQVKYRLMATANKNWSNYNPTKAGAGMLDVFAAVNATTTQSANTGIQASQLLWTGSNPITWNSVAWNSVAWNSVAWNSVAWNSDYWEP
jgi:serine protease AprX